MHHRVHNFTYNGFVGNTHPGWANFKITEFVEWTNDPGIGKFLCDDGITRLIPTFALTRDYHKSLKKIKLLPFEGVGVLIGTPCKSI